MSSGSLTWDHWEPAILRLRADIVERVLVTGLNADEVPPSLTDAYRDGILVIAGSRDDVVSLVLSSGQDRFLLLTAPVLVPRDITANADRFMDDDPRVATVSFWSNAAGALSFPHFFGPTAYPTPGLTEETVTTRLRGQGPLKAVPIGLPWGAAHVVNALAVDAVGGLSVHQDHAMAPSLEVFGAAGNGRGFRSMLDAQTYVTYSADLCPWPGHWTVSGIGTVTDEPRENVLRLMHLDVGGKRRPLNLAFQAARAGVSGLRVIIDGSCLGDFEMGTQVQAIALIEALARHPQISYLGVGIANADLPSYAHGLLRLPNVHVRQAPGLDYASFPHVDIIHVPYQPGPLPWSQWTEVSHRIVVTIQDLIAYDNASYHSNFDAWMQQRDAITEGVERADLVVAISPDVRSAIQDACLDVPDTRLVTVDQGTDHLSGAEQVKEPMALRNAGLNAAPFVLVLGASYAHKNRALAMRAWETLRAEGYPHELVMVGVTVGRGSDHLGESRTFARSVTGIHVIPDVSSVERNWLLKHASLVLYPTSAEGFGLVPYEAATFGTPTVHVDFGPLADNLPVGPGVSSDWSPESLAAAMKELIDDPAVAHEVAQRIRMHAEELTWQGTADQLVQHYLRILSAPGRSRASVQRETLTDA